MDVIKWGLLFEYCDICAKKYNYPIKTEKVRDCCKLCGRIDWINQVLQSSIVDCKDFNDSIWQGGGFIIDQLVPFPPEQKRETIHPTLTHILLTEKCNLYYDKDVIIITKTQTGQQIRIKL